ncbi:hypothetical protein [Priestia megaterium]|uniref:hypothetical protein n=1 Tax=Priestia megaterium TaxID=1404 RepID=UPI002877EA3A|nr:hypothetical protein [Priestia megaterium]
MKIRDLEKLMDQYGDSTLGDIIASKKGNRIHECPKCKGEGENRVCVVPGEYGYRDPIYSTKDCDVCNGVGYTERLLKPKIKTEIIGYE